jgi:hypothetical protein
MVTNESVPTMVTMTNFTLSDEQDGLSGQVSYSLRSTPKGVSQGAPAIGAEI